MTITAMTMSAVQLKRVVEARGDDVIGGGRVTDAKREPLLLLDRVLTERFPGWIFDRLGSFGRTRKPEI